MAPPIAAQARGRRSEEIVRRWNEQQTSQRNAKTKRASEMRGRPKDVDRKMTIHKCIRVWGILAHELKS